MLGLCGCFVSVGCRSASRADSYGAGGALAGAGVGYLIGDATGNEGLGTAVGAITGLVAGTVVGEGLDDIEAQNRREIEAKLGRQIAAGSVTVPDVIEMTRAGVDSNVIVNHIRSNGAAAPPTSQDLILLSQQQVNPAVIQALQAPPVQRAAPASYNGSPGPVIVQEHYYAPYPPPIHHYYRPYHCPPPHHGVSWGVSVGH